MRRLIKRLILYIKYRHKSVKLGAKSDIGIHTIFEGMNVIHDGTILDGYVGYGTYIGGSCLIIGRIGRFCSIASHVRVVEGSHPTDTFVSTHPTFFSLRSQNGETFVRNQKFAESDYADKENCIVIGNDVWIGMNVTILSGVTIGDGAIIAAGAVVTKNVAPYSIVAGVPAKLLKYRFNQEQIMFLLELKWWDKPLEWIKENAELFENIETIIQHTKS